MQGLSNFGIIVTPLMYWHTLRNTGLSTIESLVGLDDAYSLPILVVAEHLIMVLAFMMHRFSRKIDAYTQEKLLAEDYSQSTDKYKEAGKKDR